MIPTPSTGPEDVCMILNDRLSENFPAPVYLETWKKGILANRIKQLNTLLGECSLCPRACGVDRLHGRAGSNQAGVCGAGKFPQVASYGPHFGEEQPLVGRNGSGTIFFAHCNLLCAFCQNYDISHLAQGTKSSISQLAETMLEVQAMGCHNLNLVTPTHFVPQIVEALNIAIQNGFRLPLVYNCGGYENVEVIQMLEGIVDIYMPDLKFMDRERSQRYLAAEDYPEVVRRVIREMQRQVGELMITEQGLAYHGLLVRYLVMPQTSEEELESIFRFLADEISGETYINIMSQYRPLFKARKFPEIDRPTSSEEYTNARQIARSMGLRRGFN